MYLAGLPSHRLKDESIVQHIVNLVEQKAKEIQAENDLENNKEVKTLSPLT